MPADVSNVGFAELSAVIAAVHEPESGVVGIVVDSEISERGQIAAVYGREERYPEGNVVIENPEDASAVQPIRGGGKSQKETGAEIADYLLVLTGHTVMNFVQNYVVEAVRGKEPGIKIPVISESGHGGHDYRTCRVFLRSSEESDGIGFPDD